MQINPFEVLYVRLDAIEKYLQVLIEQKNTLVDNIPELLTRAQVAKLLSISLTTLSTYHKQQRLVPKRIGRRVLYSKIDVLAALKSIDHLKYKRVK